jgi:hypothetical protein
MQGGAAGVPPPYKRNRGHSADAYFSADGGETPPLRYPRIRAAATAPATDRVAAAASPSW